MKISRNLRCKSIKPATCNSRKKTQLFLTIIRNNQRMEVARRAQHRVQTITVCAFEMATIHPVVCFQVANDQLNKLPCSVVAMPTFTPNSYEVRLFPLEMQSTSGVCQL